MSAGSHRVFLPALRELEGRLSLPIPDKTRILAELEWDLEALWAGMVAQGITADEAEKKALQTLIPDVHTLEELGRLHAPLYRRATEGVRNERLRLLERSALALVMAGVLAFQTYALLQADLLGNPSPYLWPVLGGGALLLGTIVAKAFQLWIKGDHRHPDRGVQFILLLSVLILIMGISGTFMDLFQFTQILEATPSQLQLLAPTWLVRECTLLAISILLAMAGGFFWFVITQWLTLVRGAHRQALGLDGQERL
jgi:hypothetical protein